MLLIRQELYKIFHRPRTYIAFGIVTGVAFIIQAAMFADGQSFVDFVLQSIADTFDVEGNILNGYLITYIILQSLIVNIPLLVALIAGDSIAGEAGNGTLRLLLTKPVSRAGIVVSKFIASLCYTMLLLLWLAFVSLFLSLLIFGKGDMINMQNGQFTMLLQGDILWRFGAAFGYAALAMSAVASLAVFLSVFAENGIGPIISTMGIILFFTIITNLGLPTFDVLKPWLMTTHMIAWKGFFSNPVPYDAILHSSLVMVMYTALFLVLTIFIFNRKDIKS